MRKKHAVKAEKTDSRSASLRLESALDYAAFSEEETMMTFRQKNEDDMKGNKKVNVVGCIAKCFCIIVLAVSFVLCVAEGYELVPDVCALAALGVSACVSFSMISLGGKLRTFGAVFLVPTSFILIRFCGLLHLNAFDAVRFFYEYVCGMLYEKGYTFLPESGVSSVWISDEEQFTVFSTEICAFMILFFSLICVYSIMGKKIRSLYLGAFLGAYFIFSFFIGFYPSQNIFALLICSLASVFFMVTYEKSLSGKKLRVRENAKGKIFASFTEGSLSLKKIVCFILLSYSYIFIFLDAMELRLTLLTFVTSVVVSAACVLAYFTSFKLKEKNRAFLGAAVLILVVVILVTSVFVIGIFNDVAGDLNYIVSHVYHELSSNEATSNDSLPGGIFTLSHLEVMRASEDFNNTSIRLMTVWQLLIVPFSAFLLLGDKFRYILMGVFSLFITFFTFVFGFNFSFLSIVLIFVAVVCSYIMLFADALNRSARKKEEAIRRAPERLSQKKIKNERIRLSVPLHAKQGFIGVVTLAISSLVVFALIVPANLGASPKVDVLDVQLKTVRALIQAYMGNNGNITSEILGGDIGSGNVTDDPVEFNDITKVIAESSKRESFYLRGWIGKEYDSGKWNDADSLDMIRFKQKFGEAFMPDVLYTSYAEFVSRIRHPSEDMGFEYIFSTIAYNEPGAHLLLVPSYSVPNRLSYEMGYELHFFGDSVYYLSPGGDMLRDAFSYRGNQRMVYRSSSYIPDYNYELFMSETEENIRLYEYLKGLLKDLGAEKTLYSLRSSVPRHDSRILELADDNDIRYLLDMFYETALIEEEYEKYVYDEYLGLSEKIASSDRMKALYSEITKESTSSLNSAFLVADYFRKNYTYTTIPVSGDNGGGDYIESFIFDTKKGYCTHFATAMVNLLRLGGIPARYAEGYYADASEAIPVSYGADIIYQYSVMDKNAHAWVEAYIDGIGWMIFEPTAGYGNIPWDEESSSSQNTPSQIPDNDTENTDIPDDNGDESGEDIPLPPVTPDNGFPFAAKLTIVILISLALVLIVVFRPVISRERRRRSFIAHGKSGGTIMMKYLLKVFGYVGIITEEYENLNELSSGAFSKLEKYTDGSVLSFDKKGLDELLYLLQKNEFAEVELSLSEKMKMRDYIFRITDTIYRNSGFFGKIRSRFIMNVI